MKGDIGKLGWRFWGHAAAFVAAILLLFPASFSILCIAPGGHMEIEAIGDACCPSPDISIPSGRQPDNGFNATDSCRDCTDFFIATNGQEAVRESYDRAAASPFAAESFENRLSVDIPLSLCRSSINKIIDPPIPVSSSIPLRC